MFSRLSTFVEGMIDPFRAPSAPPPATVLGYFKAALAQVWVPFALMLVSGLAVTLLELQIYRYGAEIVDLAGAADHASFWGQHGGRLIEMALVVAIALPISVAVDTMIKHQMIMPPMTVLLRWQAYHHVIRQSLGFFTSEFAGLVATRIMQLGGSTRETLVKLADAIWYVVIYVISASALFLEADWRLLIPLVLWLVGYVALMWAIVPQLLEVGDEASEKRSIVSGRLVDALTNIMTVKVFSHAEREDAYTREGFAGLLSAFARQSRVISGMVSAVYLLNCLFIVADMGLGIWIWSLGLVTVGQVSLVLALALRLTGMSQWIMWEVTGIFENIGTVQESLKSVAVAHSVLDRPDAPALRFTSGEIRFEDVRFHYGKARGALEGVDLTIQPGEKIGLIGPSGAGKSTLVNVFLRLYDLASGRIVIDGQDIAEVTQDSLRGLIGVVTQDTSLLHRSIRENIKYGRVDADDREMERAAQLAHAAEFIATLDDGRGRLGYDAHVGERGVKLSGGQRQRIAIARVLLKNAPILILDEATSALDSEVEAAIQESLADLMDGKTVIAIAHRLSTIARMDRLVVMDKGRIVETGTHAELIASGGLYARLWERQTGGFIADQVEV